MVHLKFILSSGKTFDLTEESGERTEVKDIYRARYLLAWEQGFTSFREDPAAKCELWEHNKCVESYSSKEIAKKNVAIMSELGDPYMDVEEKLNWLKTRWFEV